jgi:fumarate reductase subunit D
MAWYQVACNSNATFLGVFTALIILCLILHIVCMSPLGARYIPEHATRLAVEKASFHTAIVLFLVAMLVLFACANSAAGHL